MKLTLRHTTLLATLLLLPAWAGESNSDTASSAPPPAPDMKKVSYAQGMNMALEFKENRVKVDPDVAEQAMREVMAGKPTELKDADIMDLLKQARSKGLTQLAEEDQHRVSYALGMRLAIQLKKDGANIDSKEFGQGLRDVLDGNPTKFSQTEIPTLFRQAHIYMRYQTARKNKDDGALFLANNAKTPGVTVLPSGLQYRVLEPGTGKMPSTNDLIFIKYRGTFVDGREFDRHNQYLTQVTGGIKGWQEALQRMSVGAKWQLFIPGDIGFGPTGEPAKGVGPDATVIYEMQLSEIVRPNDPRVGTGRVGHGMDGDHPEAEAAEKQSHS